MKRNDGYTHVAGSLRRTFAENYFFQTENPYNDKKLQYFMPYDELAPKPPGRMVQPEEHVFMKHANR